MDDGSIPPAASKISTGPDVDRHTLRSPHNSSAAVSRIPCELLIDIIRSTQNLGLGDTEWLNLVSVCRFWYNVAVAAPILWTDINMIHRESFLRLCLERSGVACLDVRVQGIRPAPRVYEKLLIVQEQAHRIRSLSMEYLEDLDMRCVLAMLCRSMPELKMLALRPSGQAYSVPACSQTNFPLLRFVSLARIAIHSFTSSLTDLVSLKLFYPPGCGIQMPPMDTVLDILDACPALSVLTLDNSELREDAIIYHPSSRRVSLPKLLTLLLSGIPMDVAVLLGHLIFPPEASVILQLPFGATEDDADDLTPARMIPPSRDRRTITNVILDVVDVTLIFTYDCYELYALSPTGPKLTMDLSSHAISYSSGTRVLSDIAELFSSSPVTRLRVAGDFGSIPVNQWRQYLCCFPLLERLDVSDLGESSSLFRALGSSVSDDEDRYLCPRLQEFIVDLCCPFQVYVDDIVVCLEYRASRGVRLKRFGLRWNDEDYRHCLTPITLETMNSAVDRLEYARFVFNGFFSYRRSELRLYEP
ncbi:hypothetical protein BKA93DRAFT_810292 [Sparassis latifolia]|uniref:Uncharacterized protein n=1 Tax=Sparassis crispa TaxID=139825 RepID=A0A401H6X3_9APHY|nr:hypothetical protein SCP_1801550 [Sparassis crispa]GBE90131.1 hypothetical protein SCP_1801550 [Sparassis crispa]